MVPTHELIAVKDGVAVLREYCFNWVEADDRQHELMATGRYDEVEMKEIE
jgi:hypothetical protein